MSTLRELDERRAELTGLRQLFETATDELFEKPLLRSKIATRETELAVMERDPVTLIPEAELLFGGRAVNGSLGLEAKFASAVLESYQDMVSNHHGGRLHPSMGGTGRRPGEQESRLFLTALPRGSFGLRLSQPQAQDFIAAQQVSEAMEELTSLVESAAAGDAAFAQGVERFHPRVLVPLKNFLDTLVNRETTVTIRSGQRETSLGPDQVKAARNRVAATKTENETITLAGVFRGVLPDSWKFDFVPDGQSLISGALAEAVTEAEAEAMVPHYGKRCRATLTTTRFRTLGRLSRPTYELLKLEPETPALTFVHAPRRLIK